jgi:hypothetical protein
MKKSTKARRSFKPRQREYDFRDGVRGKYADRMAAGSSIVVLDPDVAELFPDAESLNRVLRALGSALKGRRSTRRR